MAINPTMLHLPTKVYADTSVTASMLTAFDEEFSLFYEAATDIVTQRMVTAATWGLENWERQLGLPVNPSSVADSDRRARILAKGFLAFLPRTRANVRAMVASWGLTDFEVIENTPSRTVTISFNSLGGAPTDAVFMQFLLRQLIPSHLGLSFNFNYLTWDELDSMGLDWNDLDAMGWTWDTLEVAG